MLFSVDLTGSFNTTEPTPYIQNVGNGYNISFKVQNIGDPMRPSRSLRSSFSHPIASWSSEPIAK